MSDGVIAGRRIIVGGGLAIALIAGFDSSAETQPISGVKALR